MGGTNFERTYIKHGDLFLWEMNSMGQTEYKMMTRQEAGADYRWTFKIEGTDGTYCGPKLINFRQPLLLERQEVQKIQLELSTQAATTTTTEALVDAAPQLRVSAGAALSMAIAYWMN